MKIYLLSQTQHNDYDTYDSCVVVAANEDDARQILPGGNTWEKKGYFSSWCASPDDVTVEYVGEASLDRCAGEIICASFNAG